MRTVTNTVFRFVLGSTYLECFEVDWGICLGGVEVVEARNWKLSSVQQWGLIVSVRVLVTSVTSSLLPANADVKNVWNVISTYTFIHNVRVHSWNAKMLNWYKYWTLSVALWFVTTHWFWKLTLLVSWSTKIRIWYFLSWQYEAENQSLSLLCEAGPACKMLTSYKS